jgi:isopentenyldiphosphate isomerase
MTQPTEEILDLVNENDEVIGTMPRSEVHSQGLHNYRVINCFIKNSEGKLWTPRRQPTKRLFPNGLDFSCGGHVSSGETYLDAFAKEMSEELNIDITKVTYKELGFCSPLKDGVSSFMRVYEITSDTVPDYNPEDFSSYEWLYPEEVLQKIEQGEKTKGDLSKLIRKFYTSNL